MVAMAITENVATEATVVPPLPHGVANGGKRNVAARFHAMRDEIVRNPLLWVPRSEGLEHVRKAKLTHIGRFILDKEEP